MDIKQARGVIDSLEQAVIHKDEDRALFAVGRVAGLGLMALIEAANSLERIAQAMEPKAAPVATMPPDFRKMAEAFCAWPLPPSVCPDLCAMNPDYEHRRGTDLLTVDQAEQMFRHVHGAMAASEPTPQPGHKPSASPYAHQHCQFARCPHDELCEAQPSGCLMLVGKGDEL